jgi:hypothetical protein
MANPKVGQRDKQGRYWTGSGWKSLDQVMQAQQKVPGKTGETVKLPGVGEIKYTGDKYGWQTASTVASRQQQKPAPKPEATKPAPKPEATKPAPKPEATKPAPKPEATKPAPTKPAPGTIKPSDQVSKYMAAASAARQSKDPAQMAKVRDMGMEIWKAKYKDTLAKKVSPTGQQLGTGQSDMAKQAAELRALRPAPQAPGSEKPGYSGPPTPIAPQAQSRLSGGSSYSPAATKLMSQRTKNVLGVKEQYDAFDLVLEYLLSQGHVDTLDEALYVMMEMSAETVQHIVEGIMPDPINPDVHRRLQRIEKAAKLQKGTTGPESQAAGSAVKRLGGSGVTLPGV